jgi:hypothetical protein
MIKELDIVVLKVDLPKHDLQAGLKGTVVDILGGGQEYTVEFFTPEGKTIDVAPVSPEQIRRLDTIQEHQRIVFMEDLPQYGLKVGDVGTVVHIYDAGETYEIEILNVEGEIVEVVTVMASQVRPAYDTEILHARPLAIQAA